MMVIADLYRVAVIGQNIIVKDHKNDWEVVYNGDIDDIPFILFDKKIRWLGTSGVYVDTLELIIE